MISMSLRVVTDSGEATYSVTPRVQVAFEREWKVGLPKAFQTELRLEHLYWLGWRSAQASGDVVKPFDQWLDSVRSVETVEGAEGPLSQEG
jgi:hypothetical protein